MRDIQVPVPELRRKLGCPGTKTRLAPGALRFRTLGLKRHQMQATVWQLMRGLPRPWFGPSVLRTYLYILVDTINFVILSLVLFPIVDAWALRLMRPLTGRK